ncbi:MAG TPA: hemin uptake protein HemP [Burkholderiaceae bacterium]
MTQRVGPHPNPLPEGEGASIPSREGEARGRVAVRGREPLRINSDQLFVDGAVELQIDHHGVLYRLKQTSLGKLILTK